MRLVLVVAHGQVIGDGVAEHVTERVGLSDPAPWRADHHGELALVVDLGGLRRQLDRAVRPGQAVRELGEQHRVVRIAAPSLLDVRLVVEADAEDPGGVRHQGPQLRPGGGEGVGGAAPRGSEDLRGGCLAELGQAGERYEQVTLDLGGDRRAGLVEGGRIAHGSSLSVRDPRRSRCARPATPA